MEDEPHDAHYVFWKVRCRFMRGKRERELFRERERRKRFCYFNWVRHDVEAEMVLGEGRGRDEENVHFIQRCGHHLLAQSQQRPLLALCSFQRVARGHGFSSYQVGGRAKCVVMMPNCQR
jgi:hypothetical protein